MRALPALALLSVLPLAAQVPASRWTFGLHHFSPTFDGRVLDTSDTSNNWDLKQDFAIGKDRATPGIFLSYDGPRFGLLLSMDGQTYKGAQRLVRSVTVDNVTFPSGTDLRSEVELKAFDLAWTIRLFRWEQAWIGLDLGAHSWSLEVQADGQTQVGPSLVSGRATESATVPIPQLGVSAGGHFLEDRAVVRASVRWLGAKGASYTRFGVDARYYVTPWLGLRAFFDTQAFDAPRGSLDDDKEMRLDRSGAGFGLVARW